MTAKQEQFNQSYTMLRKEFDKLPVVDLTFFDIYLEGVKLGLDLWELDHKARIKKEEEDYVTKH